MQTRSVRASHSAFRAVCINGNDGERQSDSPSEFQPARALHRRLSCGAAPKANRFEGRNFRSFYGSIHCQHRLQKSVAIPLIGPTSTRNLCAAAMAEQVTGVDIDEQVIEKKPAPGGDVPTKEKILGAGASALQSFAPVKQICQTVCGLHCYAHDGSRQVEAHHFCSHLSGDMRQCVVYDSNRSDARLIGVEYIISRRLFDSLPTEEKKYWHSHEYEVKSGMLVAPGIPTPLELQEMQSLVDTYGKTWHLWQVDRGDPLPLGPAQLMTSFTGDNQVNKELLAETHGKFGYDTEKIREDRKKLQYPENLPDGCDQLWTKGKSWQAKMEETDA